MICWYRQWSAGRDDGWGHRSEKKNPKKNLPDVRRGKGLISRFAVEVDCRGLDLGGLMCWLAAV